MCWCFSRRSTAAGASVGVGKSSFNAVPCIWYDVQTSIIQHRICSSRVECQLPQVYARFCRKSVGIKIEEESPVHSAQPLPRWVCHMRERHAVIATWSRRTAARSHCSSTKILPFLRQMQRSSRIAARARLAEEARTEMSWWALGSGIDQRSSRAD